MVNMFRFAATERIFDFCLKLSNTPFLLINGLPNLLLLNTEVKDITAEPPPVKILATPGFIFTTSFSNRLFIAIRSGFPGFIPCLVFSGAGSKSRLNKAKRGSMCLKMAAAPPVVP